jgi:2-methylfumaryl-CoA isomerase
MYRLLADMRVVEGAAFVAAPMCALHLAQLGAEVIRIDAIGGGPDFLRWPRAPGGGASLYWEGLNKGKKSVALNLSSPEGRELAVALATAPGEGAGLFVTNYPVGGFLAHEKLAARRPDMITVRVMGWPDAETSAIWPRPAIVAIATSPSGTRTSVPLPVRPRRSSAARSAKAA